MNKKTLSQLFYVPLKDIEKQEELKKEMQPNNESRILEGKFTSIYSLNNIFSMKNVRVIFTFIVFVWCFTCFPVSSFAQLDKEACKEILSNLDMKEFEGISIITHVLTTDSLVQKPSIYIFSPLLIVFKETYLTIRSDNEKNKRTMYLPYNKIKFISTYNWRRVFSSGNTIEIYLIE